MLNEIKKNKKFNSKDSDSDSENSLLEYNNQNPINIKKTITKKNKKKTENRRISIHGNNSLLLSLGTLTPEQFIQKGLELFKNPNRNFDQNQIVIEYLMNLNPFAHSIQKVKKDNSRDLFSSLSFTLKHKFLEKNKIIYKFNEPIDNFYIILNGKVDLLVPNEEYIKLSEAEYFIYLLKLRKYNEKALLDKTLKNNNSIYPMNEENFDIWLKRAIVTIQNHHMKINQKEKYMNKRISLIKRQSVIKRQSIMKNYKPKSKGSTIIKSTMTFQPRNSIISKNLIGIKPFENDDEKDLVLLIQDKILETYINIEKPLLPKSYYHIIENDHNKISAEQYIKRIKPEIKDEQYLKYNINRKDVLISSYFIAESLSNGEKFGDEIYDNNFYNDEDLRVETVITSVDTDLAYLPKNIYSEILKETNEKSKKEKINFLMGLNILQSNNKKNNNLRNFTNYFKQKICKYREILYYENAPYENNHFIYFIQNGEFETYGNKSLQEIDQILLNSNYKNKLNKIEMDELGNVKEYYYKKQLKFECFGENDVIGLSDCIYNNHYLFTVSCKTNNAIVYEININFFKVLLNNNPHIQENFETMQRIKNNIFLNTLYKQRLSEVQYIYVKYKDNPVFYFNLSHGINSYNKTKYAEKKFILQIKRPLSQNNLEKKKKKDKDSFMETSLIKNKIQSSEKKHNSSKFSRRKYSYNIDLIIRDEETANSSKHHHLNTFSMNTESNFIFEPKKRLNTQNKKQINLFKSRNLYLKSIKKNVLKNNKIIKLNYLSVDNSKNDLNNKINSNTNSNNNTFTNPLAYDDFDRKYNSFRYFKPKKEDLNDKLYRLEISSAIPIKKKKKRFLSMV